MSGASHTDESPTDQFQLRHVDEAIETSSIQSDDRTDGFQERTTRQFTVGERLWSGLWTPK